MAGITDPLADAIRAFDTAIADAQPTHDDYTRLWRELHADYRRIYDRAGHDTEYTDPHEPPDPPDPCAICGGIGWTEDEEGFAIDCDHGQPWDDGSDLFIG
jgi:hypothetical protein